MFLPKTSIFTFFRLSCFPIFFVHHLPHIQTPIIKLNNTSLTLHTFHKFSAHPFSLPTRCSQTHNSNKNRSTPFDRPSSHVFLFALSRTAKVMTGRMSYAKDLSSLSFGNMSSLMNHQQIFREQYFISLISCRNNFISIDVRSSIKALFPFQGGSSVHKLYRECTRKTTRGKQILQLRKTFTSLRLRYTLQFSLYVQSPSCAKVFFFLVSDVHVRGCSHISFKN